MGIRMVTSMSEIDASLAQIEQRTTDVVVRKFCQIGEQCVNHARSLPSPNPASFPDFPHIPPHQPNYIDWTANLRSSIGYVVSIDGKVVFGGGFLSSGKGEDGARSGREYATAVAKLHSRGIALIVVAGMKYASYVTNKGYDVIESAELLANKIAPTLLREIGFEINGTKH